MREAEEQVDAAALADAHRRYAEERDALIAPERTGPRPSGGVGGTRQGVKCLHAHVAWWLAGGDDPVGAWTAATAGPAHARRRDRRCPSVILGAMRVTGAVAAVDCGTNSTRLLVVGPSGDVEAREMRITRLGEGVDATRTLRPEAMERTFAALREFRSIMDATGVVRARLVATSAVRDAENGEAFLGPASEIVGAAGRAAVRRGGGAALVCRRHRRPAVRRGARHRRRHRWGLHRDRDQGGG